MQQLLETETRGSISTVLIVDDHPLYSDALASALELVFKYCIIKKAQTLAQATTLLDDGFTPDLIMFDLKLPDVSGISGFRSVRARVPDTPILVISSLASTELVQSLLREGAAGFLPKETPAKVLKTVLAEVAAGRVYVPQEYQASEDSVNVPPTSAYELHPKLAILTPQQQRIMRLICEGKPNKQIAYELSLAEATVKAHITALLRRLQVQNRTQAAVLVESANMEVAAQSNDPEARAFLNQ